MAMNQDHLDKLIKEFQARRNAVKPNAVLLHFPAPETEEEETPAGDPVQQFIARAAAARNRQDTQLGVTQKAEGKAALLVKMSDYLDKDIKKNSPEWTRLRQLIWERDEKRCKQCHKDLTEGHYHCHHILAEVHGGKGEPTNLTTLCERCHDQTHTKETPAGDPVQQFIARAAAARNRPKTGHL